MKILRLIDKALARFEGWLIITLLWLMVTFTFVQVFLRGLYTHAHLQWANALMGYLDWSDPFVRLLLLWLAFLGASLITGENKHIKIDLFSTLLPPKLERVRDLLLSVACMVISAFMVKACIDYIRMEMEFGGSMFLNLPDWAGQIILPAGFALILFRFSIRAIDQGIKILREVTK